jgi:hypothetical protein
VKFVSAGTRISIKGTAHTGGTLGGGAGMELGRFITIRQFETLGWPAGQAPDVIGP